MESIDLYRMDDSLYTTIKLDEGSQQTKIIMGENAISLRVRSSSAIPFKINDYCTVFDEVYILKDLPVAKKLDYNYYDYEFTMQAKTIVDLNNVLFLFLGADNTLRTIEFSIMGTAEVILDLVIQNANRVSPGWVKGQVLPTIAKNVSFSKETCLAALGRLAEEFKTEFWVEGNKIHLTKRLRQTGFTFKVGANKGLYELTRYNSDSATIITRLYAVGGTKNLPPDYNNYEKRLQMRGDTLQTLDEPFLIHDVLYTVTDNGDDTITVDFTWTPPTDGSGTVLVFEYRLVGNIGTWSENAGFFSGPRSITMPKGSYNFRFVSIYVPFEILRFTTKQIVVAGTISTPVLPSSDYPTFIYIEQNTDLYGVIEQPIFFDDIYPDRIGIVSSVTDPFNFTDDSLDFNINSQLLPGASAKVTFNTGQLAGYTFDISVYDNATKKITILQNKNETKLDVPSTLLTPAVGDEYVLTDIIMPDSYIINAEQRLYAEAVRYLDQFSSPQLTVAATLDEKYMKARNRTLRIGDTIYIVDDPLGISRKLRITSVIRSLIKEYAYEIVLAEVITINRLNELIAGTGVARDVNNLGQNVTTQDIWNGRLILPQTAGGSSFQIVVIETATNKLYRVT